MRRVSVRIAFDSHTLENRRERFAELAEGVLGFPDIHHAEAVRALSSGVRKQARDRPIGARFHAILLPTRESLHGFFVRLLRQGRGLNTATIGMMTS